MTTTHANPFAQPSELAKTSKDDDRYNGYGQYKMPDPDGGAKPKAFTRVVRPAGGS